jgi:hypothetical protein
MNNSLKKLQIERIDVKMLKEMFSSKNQTATNGGANQLEKTAQLTAVSTEIANTVLGLIEADEEKFKLMVVESQKSHDAMDKLIAECYDLDAVDVDYLSAESADTLDKMIRSQQSKRSRAKSKVMTLENYKAMMTGAVAENLLRIASGKPKSAGGGNHNTSDVGFNDDELQKLAADQELLKKAIRNVQSKKSIMKSKADFDEASDRWQQLLKAEDQLKALRDDRPATVDPEVQKAADDKKKVEELLKDVDNIDQLKAADAKGMLAKIKEMLAGK